LKKGFASIYLVYSFLIIFVVFIMSFVLLSNYKGTFLNTLKDDIKNELNNYKLPLIIDIP